jgi:hypothetical protein
MNRRSRGYSVVEGMVAGVLLTIVISTIWTAVSQGHRREARLDFQLHALQTASLACTRLQDDFSQLIPQNIRSADGEEGPGLVLDRVHEKPGTPLPLTEHLETLVQTVNYMFDPKSHYLLRDGRPVGTGSLADLTMEYHASPSDGYTLKVNLKLDGPGKRTRGLASGASSYSFEFHSPQGTLALVHGAWVGEESL